MSLTGATVFPMLVTSRTVLSSSVLKIIVVLRVLGSIVDYALISSISDHSRKQWRLTFSKQIIFRGLQIKNHGY